MSRKYLLSVLAASGLFALLILTPSGQVASQSIREVFVTNFPRVQQVEGKVEIDGPVALSRSVSVTEILVPPVKPTDTTRLVSAGTLHTEGFPNVVLSLHGRVKGSVAKAGTIGAILLPVEPTIQEAFDELGLVQFEMGVVADKVLPGTAYFASNQPRYGVAFDSYDVWLYNTTDKTVTVNLHAYLTN